MSGAKQIMWQSAGNADREILGPRRQALGLRMVPHWTEKGSPSGGAYAPSSELREETINLAVLLHCK